MYIWQGEASAAAQMFVHLARYVMLAYGDHSRDRSLTECELTLIGCGLTKADMRRVEMAVTTAQNSHSAVCIVCGGETTVEVTGTGKGGRNQEMALRFASLLNKLVKEEISTFKVYQNFQVEFLSAGTDGQDGPTDAAGAIVNKNIVAMADTQGLNIDDYLANNDSYSLFKALQGSDCLIETGLTGTNVMDIQLLTVQHT